MRYVVLASEGSDGYGSVRVHSVISLHFDEGAGRADSTAGEGFNAGMRRVAHCRNHVVILTRQVDHYEAEPNAYGGKVAMSDDIS